jgi:hypothetical protein
MCGRFTQKCTWEELHRLYRLTQPAHNLRPRYDICPTDRVDVIVPHDGALAVVPMRWQLIPPWWKKPLKELPATFNARAETVADKPGNGDDASLIEPVSGRAKKGWSYPKAYISRMPVGVQVAVDIPGGRVPGQDDGGYETSEHYSEYYGHPDHVLTSSPADPLRRCRARAAEAGTR